MNIRRCGSIYVAVLSVVTLLTVTALTGIAVTRADRAALLSDGDVAAARLAARGAVEVGLAMAEADRSWRTAYGSGAWFTDRRVDDSMLISLHVRDTADGVLAGDETQAVEFQGTGRVNGARQVVRVTLDPAPRGYEALGSSAHSVLAMEVNTDDFDAEGDMTSATEVETKNGVLDRFGWFGIGSARVRGGVADLSVPPMTKVMAELETIATDIPYLSIPGGEMRDGVLTATSNTWGDVNPRGVYVIDARGSQLKIRDVYFSATLLVKNAGSGVEVFQTYHWEPGEVGLPMLVVDGEVLMNPAGGNADLTGVVTTPLSSEDADAVGRTWPTRSEGVIFTSGGFEAAGSFDHTGSIVSLDRALFSGTVRLRNGVDSKANPPHGFVEWYRLMFRPGSWQRVVQN